MIASLYHMIEQAGYHQPLHPVMVFIPSGCIAAACIFTILSRAARNPSYFQSARHCMGLALVFLPVAALTGYLDWQHYFAGAWLLAVKIKMGSAAVLLLVLVGVNTRRAKLNRASFKRITAYFLCLVLVFGIGYFGGELVYGSHAAQVNELTQSNPAVQ